MTTFLRQDTRRHSRLGKKRPKLQKWRKPRGLHNKVRKKRGSYPIQPSVGHKVAKKDKGKISGLTPILVSNVADLSKVGKDNIAVIAKIGAKKRLEVLKKAQEMKIKVKETRKKKEAKKDAAK